MICNGVKLPSLRGYWPSVFLATLKGTAEIRLFLQKSFLGYSQCYLTVNVFIFFGCSKSFYILGLWRTNRQRVLYNVVNMSVIAKGSIFHVCPPPPRVLILCSLMT